MSNIPENLRYSKDHEWASVEGDIATIGLTDYAQHSLGDVVYVDMPRVGDKFDAHESFGSVESVKAVSEIFMPVSGEVTEVNDGLNDAPETVNNDPYDGGWLVKVKMANAGEADALLSSAEYEEFLEGNS
ncbi:MAG: glycine cleavage system protein GcvH [Chloracidobacterium sp.]|nr:glycine cleavage system protein GcvH [Chloracidobacterium sp.]MCC6824934.1 glycine cleavage system protein GcvH [Acidobacteriota bacterium]MCO5333253.1 glycine cleavage system protein GcvH [Pyrinomonadaceae bacterium]